MLFSQLQASWTTLPVLFKISSLRSNKITNLMKTTITFCQPSSFQETWDKSLIGFLNHNTSHYPDQRAWRLRLSASQRRRLNQFHHCPKASRNKLVSWSSLITKENNKQILFRILESTRRKDIQLFNNYHLFQPLKKNRIPEWELAVPCNKREHQNTDSRVKLGTAITTRVSSQITLLIENKDHYQVLRFRTEVSKWAFHQDKNQYRVDHRSEVLMFIQLRSQELTLNSEDNQLKWHQMPRQEFHPEVIKVANTLLKSTWTTRQNWTSYQKSVVTRNSIPLLENNWTHHSISMITHLCPPEEIETRLLKQWAVHLVLSLTDTEDHNKQSNRLESSVMITEDNTQNQ